MPEAWRADPGGLGSWKMVVPLLHDGDGRNLELAEWYESGTRVVRTPARRRSGIALRTVGEVQVPGVEE